MTEDLQDFTIDNVFPWGRSKAEYIKMFTLTDRDLQSYILDCGAGPSSFNCEQYKANNKVISCDPIYKFSVEQIKTRIEATASVIMERVKTNYDNFVWQHINSPKHLYEIRMSAMQQFLEDFSEGIKQERYINQSLPNLAFDRQQFDLALCSHFLFTYSEQFSFEFHRQSILEMCRVAKEVRIFPLLESFTGEVSPYLNGIIKTFSADGYQVMIEPTPYEFQINGNQMLKINKF